MPKSMEDVKSALLAADDGQDLYEVVTNAVSHERNTGKGLVKNIQAKLDSQTEVLKGIGYNPSQDDLQNFLNGVREKADQTDQTTAKLSDSEKRFLSMEKNIQTLTDKLSETEKREGEAKKALELSTIRAEVSKRLKNKVFGEEAHLKAILADNLVKLDESGSVIWENGDGQKDLDSGIAEYFEKNKDAVKTDHKRGAGGGPSQSQAGGKTMQRNAYEALAPAEKMAFTSDGGTLYD